MTIYFSTQDSQTNYKPTQPQTSIFLPKIQKNNLTKIIIQTQPHITHILQKQLIQIINRITINSQKLPSLTHLYINQKTMGNKSLNNTNTILHQNWITATQPTSTFFTHVNLYRTRLLINTVTHDYIEQYIIHLISQQQYINYLKQIQWRQKLQHCQPSAYIPSIRSFIDTSSAQLCSRSYTITIYFDRIQMKLTQINDIPFQDAMYMLRICLQGFKILMEHFGYFRIGQDQIFINSQGQVKVWIHPNLASILVNKQQKYFQNQFENTKQHYNTYRCIPANKNKNKMIKQSPISDQHSKYQNMSLYSYQGSQDKDKTFMNLRLVNTNPNMRNNNTNTNNSHPVMQNRTISQLSQQSMILDILNLVQRNIDRQVIKQKQFKLFSSYIKQKQISGIASGGDTGRYGATFYSKLDKDIGNDNSNRYRNSWDNNQGLNSQRLKRNTNTNFNKDKNTNITYTFTNILQLYQQYVQQYCIHVPRKMQVITNIYKLPIQYDNINNTANKNSNKKSNKNSHIGSQHQFQQPSIYNLTANFIQYPNNNNPNVNNNNNNRSNSSNKNSKINFKPTTPSNNYITMGYTNRSNQRQYAQSKKNNNNNIHIHIQSTLLHQDNVTNQLYNGYFDQSHIIHIDTNSNITDNNNYNNLQNNAKNINIITNKNNGKQKMTNLSKNKYNISNNTNNIISNYSNINNQVNNYKIITNNLQMYQKQQNISNKTHRIITEPIQYTNNNNNYHNVNTIKTINNSIKLQPPLKDTNNNNNSNHIHSLKSINPKQNYHNNINIHTHRNNSLQHRMVNPNNSITYQYYNNSEYKANYQQNYNDNNGGVNSSISSTASNAKMISNNNTNANRKINQVISHSHTPVINNSSNQSTATHILTPNPYTNPNNQIYKKYHSPMSTLLQQKYQFGNKIVRTNQNYQYMQHIRHTSNQSKTANTNNNNNNSNASNININAIKYLKTPIIPINNNTYNANNNKILAVTNFKPNSVTLSNNTNNFNNLIQNNMPNHNPYSNPITIPTNYINYNNQHPLNKITQIQKYIKDTKNNIINQYSNTDNNCNKNNGNIDIVNSEYKNNNNNANILKKGKANINTNNTNTNSNNIRVNPFTNILTQTPHQNITIITSPTNKNTNKQLPTSTTIQSQQSPKYTNTNNLQQNTQLKQKQKQYINRFKNTIITQKQDNNKYYTTSESYQIDSQIAGDLADINSINGEQYNNNNNNNSKSKSNSNRNRKISNINSQTGIKKKR